MFEFETIEKPSMNLNKHWVDYVTLNKKKENPELLSKTERFRQNTSGQKYGDREYIEHLVRDLASRKTINSKIFDENTIYQKLMDKIETVADFDINAMALTDIRNGFNNYVWRFVINEITTTTYKKSKDSPEIEYVDENEKESNSDDKGMLSTSDLLYHNGRLFDEFEEAEYDNNQAKKDIIESLEVFNRYNKTKFITTKDKREVNSLRLLQHHIAMERLHEEKERIDSIRGTVEKKHLKTITSSRKNSGSLGLGDKAYFNKTIDIILQTDLLGRRDLVNNFKKFWKAIDRLEIDIIWVNADEIVTDEYIQKLKGIIFDNSLVFVSQEELDVLESSLNLDDYKINEVRNELNRNKDVNKRDITDFFTERNIDKIKRIKASELRRISRLTKEMVNEYIETVKETPVLGLSEVEKRETSLLTHTSEYLQRLREVETTVLTSGYTLESGEKLVKLSGVLSAQSLTVIKKSTESYFSKMLEDDPRKVRRIMLDISDKYLVPYTFEGKTYEVESDKNGFLYYEYTDEKGFTYKKYLYEKIKSYRMTSNDTSIKVETNKWLINEKGYYVFKFVDGHVRPGRENVKLWYGSVEDGSAYQIRDFNKKEIPIIL